MQRSTAVFVLAFAFATIADVEAAHATAMAPPHPDSSRLCAGCAGFKEGNLREDLDQSISSGTSAAGSSAGGPDWGEEVLLVEDAPTIVTITGSLELGISIKDWQASLGGDSCNYLGSELHDPRRVEDECSSVEPGSDYFELMSVLTLTIVSVLFFGFLAAAWLLHRSYRNRRLQIIASQRSMAHSHIRRRHRRAGGSMYR
jgi:hypothetical protein